MSSLSVPRRGEKKIARRQVRSEKCLKDEDIRNNISHTQAAPLAKPTEWETPITAPATPVGVSLGRLCPEAPPPLSSTTRSAAVAGDADNINKQARKMRTNWVTNKQTADGFLRSAAVEGARTA